MSYDVDEWITVREFARRNNVSAVTVYNRLKDGTLPSKIEHERIVVRADAELKKRHVGGITYGDLTLIDAWIDTVLMMVGRIERRLDEIEEKEEA